MLAYSNSASRSNRTTRKRLASKPNIERQTTMHTTTQQTEANRGKGQGEDIKLTAEGGAEGEKGNRAASRKARRAQAPSGTDCETVSLDWFGATLANEDIDAATAIMGMAHASGGAFARKWEAKGGRPMTLSDVEETRAIYHAEFSKAARLSGLVAISAEGLARIRAERDDKRAMPTNGEAFAFNAIRPLAVRNGNPLHFRALLQWRKAMRAANRKARSFLYGGGAENYRVVSMDEARANDEGDALAYGDTLSAENLATYCQPIGKRGARRLRLALAHVRESLTVYWMLKGGQRWKTALKDDLRRAAHCARAARGGSLGIGALGELLSAEGADCSDTMRQTAKRLRDRIAKGDEQSTLRPELAAQMLSIYRCRNWDANPIVRGESDEARDKRELLAWARHRAERLAK